MRVERHLAFPETLQAEQPARQLARTAAFEAGKTDHLAGMKRQVDVGIGARPRQALQGEDGLTGLAALALVALDIGAADQPDQFRLGDVAGPTTDPTTAPFRMTVTRSATSKISSR